MATSPLLRTAERSTQLFLILLLWAAEASAQERLNAKDWQLFIDNEAIARATGIDRVVHHPRPMGIVIPAEKPWETNGTAPEYFARKPDGTFFGYYDAIWSAPDSGARSSSITDMVYANGAWRSIVPDKHPEPGQQYVGAMAYATSRDGIHWDKPNLGLIDAPSGADWTKYPPSAYPTGCSRNNNLVAQIRIGDLGRYGAVTDPAKRFAISAGGRIYFASELPDFAHDPDWRSKLVEVDGTFSPRWHFLSFWDTAHGEWVAITQNTTAHWLPTRTIGRFASKDLKSWRSEMVLAPDPEDPHSPGCYDEPMMLSPFCSEGIVFGLLGWFHSDRTTPDGGPVMEKKFAAAQGWPWPVTPAHPYVWPWARKGINEMRITISRDGGRTWDRTSSREAWIPYGTEEDAYDRQIQGGPAPLRVGDEDWFYISVINGSHMGIHADALPNPDRHDRLTQQQIALYVQKHDRYVSLSTGSQVETLITKPFVVDGDKLQLNVDASRGRVRVGICEYKPVATLARKAAHGMAEESTPSTDPYLMEQNILPGFTMADCRPIQANGIEQAVEFRSGPSLKSIRGRTVVLFVEMLDSDLYGFRVR